MGGVDVRNAAATAPTRFAALLEQERFRKTRRLLADPGSKGIEIAVAVGDSDSANFTRALRRWTGASPQQYRRASALP